MIGNAHYYIASAYGSGSYDSSTYDGADTTTGGGSSIAGGGSTDGSTSGNPGSSTAGSTAPTVPVPGTPDTGFPYIAWRSSDGTQHQVNGLLIGGLALIVLGSFIVLSVLATRAVRRTSHSPLVHRRRGPHKPPPGYDTFRMG